MTMNFDQILRDMRLFAWVPFLLLLIFFGVMWMEWMRREKKKNRKRKERFSFFSLDSAIGLLPLILLLFEFYVSMKTTVQINRDLREQSYIRIHAEFSIHSYNFTARHGYVTVRFGDGPDDTLLLEMPAKIDRDPYGVGRDYLPVGDNVGELWYSEHSCVIVGFTPDS